MTYALLWDNTEKRFNNVTRILAAFKDEKHKKETNQTLTRENNLLDNARSTIHLHAMTADWKKNILRAQSSDSFLIVQLFPGDPLLMPILRIRARLSSPRLSDNWMEIYWVGSKNQSFSEDKKLSFSWPIDNKVRRMDIPLGRIIALLQDRPIIALRFDFTSSPAQIHIKEFRLLSDEN